MHLLWIALLTFAILQTSILNTTIYLHRAMTHAALTLHPAVAFIMHLQLYLFTGIVPRKWAAVHRKHHKFSDEEGDPHSPLLKGLWKVLFGNFLMYRQVIKQDKTLLEKFTPHWKPDLVDKVSLGGWGVLGGLMIFCLMFGVIWGTVAWFTHIVLYILLNAMINSLGHKIGYRNYEEQQATNLRSLALFTGGEGLHNNHHEFPSSARFARRRGEIDLAWPVIRFLEWCGLAQVKPVPIDKTA